MQRTKIVMLMGGVGLLLAAHVARVDAAGIVPTSRFDERAQMCRALTFYNSGWVSKGAAIFRNSCKNCHHRGNDKGTPFLYTESRTPRGWNRVFFEKYPKCAQDGSWVGLSKEELMQVNDYLYLNAYGTYDPNNAESCG